MPYFAPDELDRRVETTVAGAPIQGIQYPNDYLDDGVDAIRIGWPQRALSNDEKAFVYNTYWKQLPYAVEKYSGATPIKAAAASLIASGAMGPNRWCQTRPVTPLSANFTALRASLASMPTARHTNIPLALMWGWHVLSPNAPFSDGKPYGTANVRKVLVLMTDGENLMDPPGGSVGENTDNFNKSYYGPYGYTWRGALGLAVTPATAAATVEAQVASTLNQRMATICSNMKASGRNVTVYTIQFAQGGVPDPNLVQCATPGGYRNAAQANQLDAAFRSIAEAISDLRVAR